VDFRGGNIAVVRVTTHYFEPNIFGHETFIVVKEAGSSRIRAHQSID
jgi:hypothetical protein